MERVLSKWCASPNLNTKGTEPSQTRGWGRWGGMRTPSVAAWNLGEPKRTIQLGNPAATRPQWAAIGQLYLRLKEWFAMWFAFSTGCVESPDCHENV